MPASISIGLNCCLIDSQKILRTYDVAGVCSLFLFGGVSVETFAKKFAKKASCFVAFSPPLRLAIGFIASFLFSNHSRGTLQCPKSEVKFVFFGIFLTKKRKNSIFFSKLSFFVLKDFFRMV